MITSHTLRTPEYCDRIISEGKTDMVGLSRQMIADPYWANKAKAGKVQEIRKCISCLIGCWKESLYIKREMRCAVNPAIGDERFLDLKSALTKLKVAVVGGGIAGMEAARIATLRGHQVTLFEKDDELGGILRTCCMVPPKSKMKWYMDWIREQIKDLKVEVRLNTIAKTDELKMFDVVLCGTGAKTVVPDIPGVEKAIKFEDVLRSCQRTVNIGQKERTVEAVKIGQKVLVWGNHYAATDTTEALALRGKEVIYVTEDKEIAPNIEPIHREVMMLRFNGGNGQGLEEKAFKFPVDIRLNTTVVEIKDGEVVLMNDAFEKETIAVDTVVLAKAKPNTELYDSLLAAGLHVVNIGDSNLVRNVRGAMTDGANAGLMIDGDIFMNANNALSVGYLMM